MKDEHLLEKEFPGDGGCIFYCNKCDYFSVFVPETKDAPAEIVIINAGNNEVIHIIKQV